MNIWDVSWVVLFLSIFKPLHDIIVHIKYKVYEKNSDRNRYFFIKEEPNLNKTCESFPLHKSFIAHFIDHNGNERFKYYMAIECFKVKSEIELLHQKIETNISLADHLQSYLELNPQRNDLTRKYEGYIHFVKEDISAIRKLESFYKVYNPTYKSKPEYSGEERDNVNTY